MPAGAGLAMMATALICCCGIEYLSLETFAPELLYCCDRAVSGGFSLYALHHGPVLIKENMWRRN